MYNINQLQEIISAEIEQYRWPEKPELLYQPIKYILDIGGKRVRPALLLMAYNLYADDISGAKSAAMGIEVFHNFTLLHDDIMDKSPIRRGKPTVHKHWNDNVAILSGDAMSIIANDLMLDSANFRSIEALRLFNKTAVEVCEGQQFDMDFESRTDVSETEYINMIRLKTSVLVAASLKIGAILANASESDADRLYHFGENLGIAFQLQDDYLDTFGDQDTFGKRIGNDILANKKTFLSIKALELAKGNTLAELKQWFSDSVNEHPVKKISAVKEIFTQLNVHGLIGQKIDFYHQKALADLKQVNVSDEKKAHLMAFANQLKTRDK